MRFWSLIISSAALFGLVTAASAGRTVAWAASEPATLAFVMLGLCALAAAVSQPRLAPVAITERHARR